MNLPLFLFAAAGAFFFSILLSQELDKNRKIAVAPSQQQPNTPQNANIKKDYRSFVPEVQKSLAEKKAAERHSPQAIEHLEHREATMTVDTNFQQGLKKIYGLNAMKQPIERKDYDLDKDSFSYWKQKTPTLFFCMAIICFILFLMMGV